MKALIRPTLIALARLGLFLAVVAWIVGQWRTVLANAPSAFAGICEHGLYLAFHPPLKEWKLYQYRDGDLKQSGQASLDWQFGGQQTLKSDFGVIYGLMHKYARYQVSGFVILQGRQFSEC